jgi:hypothetical protein
MFEYQYFKVNNRNFSVSGLNRHHLNKHHEFYCVG